MSNQKNQLVEKICPECGRKFIFRDHWTYKMIINHQTVNYCSWNCMRKNEKGKK